MGNYPIKDHDIPSFLAQAAKTAKYGDRLMVDDKTYVYSYASAAKTKGNLVMVGKTGATGGKNPVVADPATSAVPVRIGVAAHTITAAGGIWAQIGPGRATGVAVDATGSITEGHFLKASNGSTSAIEDGAAKSANSFAVAEAALASGTGSMTVMLLDREVTI